MADHTRARAWIIFVVLLLAGVLAVAGWQYFQEKQSRPGNRRVVLAEVKLTRHPPGLPHTDDAVVHGWFEIVAVIENREPREVSVDCSAPGSSIASARGGGPLTPGLELKPAPGQEIRSLRPQESVVLTGRLSGHFSKDDAFLRITLKTDGAEQVLERIIDKDW